MKFYSSDNHYNSYPMTVSYEDALLSQSKASNSFRITAIVCPTRVVLEHYVL